MVSRRMGWTHTVFNMRWADPRLRKHRKWMRDTVQDKDALCSYVPLRHREACIMLLGLLNRPEDFEMHIKRHVCTTSHQYAC